MTDAPLLTGHDLIADYVKRLDGSPGVYRMLDAQSRVLYVGKARSLKARVANYTQIAQLSGRLQRMVSQTRAMGDTLHHEQTNQLLLWINPKTRTRCATPVILTS